ncbi:hypothetical protein ACHAWF_013618 [Thalassiosira exigua]
MFDDDESRESFAKESKKLSPLLMRHGSQLSEKSQRKRWQKEIDNRLQFLEKESPVMNGIEEEKREELYKLQRQHEREIKKILGKSYEELECYKERVLTLEEELEFTTQELKSATQKSAHERRQLKDEIKSSARQISSLENEVNRLRGKLAEKDARMCDLEMENRKALHAQEELQCGIRAKEDEIRRRDRAILQNNEKIRSLSLRSATLQKRVENLSISGHEWEETSGLTSSSDFDLREKNPIKYDFPPDRVMATNHSKSKRRDDREDIETRRLTVSFSDEVENRQLPMHAHDNLSRRLEKMYMPR